MNAFGFDLGAECTSLEDPELEERLVLLEVLLLDAYLTCYWMPIQKSSQVTYWKFEERFLLTLSPIHP